MIDKMNFENLKELYGRCGSWAIWSNPGLKPKSNTGDMTWADDPALNEKVGTKFVFVGLNWAAGHGDQHSLEWKSFHSDYAYQNDYKLRYALSETPYWGSYITDIIKDYAETNSSIVKMVIRNRPELIDQSVKHFEKELELLGQSNPILVAMGVQTYDILQKYFGSKYVIVLVKHYSSRICKEQYRKDVLNALSSVCN